jgi:hypothetical protein
MSTNRLIPEAVNLVPPEIVLDERKRPRAPRLTADERRARAKLIADHVAHLEQIPTADLSDATMQRLSLLAIEVSSPDALGGEPLEMLGIDPSIDHLRSVEPRTNLGAC